MSDSNLFQRRDHLDDQKRQCDESTISESAHPPLIDDDAELTDEFIDDLLQSAEELLTTKSNIQNEGDENTAPSSTVSANNDMSVHSESAVLNVINVTQIESSNLVANNENLTQTCPQLHLPIAVKLEELPNSTSESDSTVPIRVKKELKDNMKSLEIENVPQVEAVRVKTEIGQPSGQVPDDSFFDDLLVDNVAQRVENFVDEDFEIKYAEKIKELQRLNEFEESKKLKKNKHKKSKRKRKNKDSHRSSDDDDDNQRYKRRNHTEQYTLYQMPSTSQSERLQVRSDMQFNSTQNEQQTNFNSQESIYPTGNVQPFAMCNESDYCLVLEYEPRYKRIKLVQPNSNTAATENKPVITVEQKKEKSLNLARNLLKNAPLREDKLKFLYTSMIRKLPNSTSMYNRQSFEDRSPLNVLQNVSYAFNSNSTKINLNEYGIERVPTFIESFARRVCIDANRIQENLKILSLQSIFKIEKQDIDNGVMEAEATGSNLYTNALIQTDESMFRVSHNAHSISTQTVKSNHNIGVQTKERGASVLSDDLPLTKLIKQLSDNQLMAMQDFAELLLEPTDSTNQSERYRIRTRIAEIYDLANTPIKSEPKDIHRLPMQLNSVNYSVNGNATSYPPYQHGNSHNHMQSNQMLQIPMSSRVMPQSVAYPAVPNEPNIHAGYSRTVPPNMYQQDSSSHIQHQQQFNLHSGEVVAQSKFFGRGGLRRH